MSKSDISDFVMQPLHKKLNRENLVSRMEKLEAGESAAAPSARVNALGEMGQSTGSLSVDELFIINHDTGVADAVLNQYGLLFRNQEGEIIFQDTNGGSTIEILSDAGNFLVVHNAFGGAGVSFLFDDASHVVKQIDFDGDGNIVLFDGFIDIPTGQTYNINGVPHTHAGGSAHTIEDEGTPLTARSKLNFVGAGVTVTDDSGDDASDVTIPGTTTEEIQDIAGAMIHNGSQTGITASYDDPTGLVNLEVQASFVNELIIDLARERLSGVRTYYVRTDGADSNPGLTDSAGGAFLTIQKAVDVASAFDNGGFDVTIQVRDGTWTDAVTLKSFVGSGNIIIQGNNGTPANVLISTTSATCFTASSVIGVYQILDLKMKTTTSGNCISAENSSVKFGNVVFDTVGLAANAHVLSSRLSWVRAISNYTIVGGVGIHLLTTTGGIIETNVASVTLTGTPAFATYANANTGIIRVISPTFTGSATGVRYNAIKNSVIDVNGAATTYLPGGTAGTTATGGIYV